MAVVVRRSLALRNTRMEADRAAINGGGGPGILNVYSLGGRATGVKLLSFTLEADCGVVANGALTLNGFPKSAPGLANNLAAEFEITNSADVVVYDAMTIGLSTDAEPSTATIDNPDVRQDQMSTISANPKFIHG